MEILFDAWLVGAVCSFFLFTKWASDAFDNLNVFEISIIIMFNICISLVWFIYIPWNARPFDK